MTEQPDKVMTFSYSPLPNRGTLGGPCVNCHDRKATMLMDTSGIANHGFERAWCEICVLEYQIDYCRKAAERLPELERRLTKLKERA